MAVMTPTSPWRRFILYVSQVYRMSWSTLCCPSQRAQSWALISSNSMVFVAVMRKRRDRIWPTRSSRRGTVSFAPGASSSRLHLPGDLAAADGLEGQHLAARQGCLLARQERDGLAQIVNQTQP